MSTMTTAGTAAFSGVYWDESSLKNSRETKVYEYRESHLTYFSRGFDVAPPAERPPINYAALSLIRSWRNEDTQKQREDWEALRQVLEEDRPSDRKLFP